MVKSLDEVSEFPLTWPEGKPRTSHREAARFDTSLAKSLQEIAYEMPRWRVRGHVVSMAPAYRRGNYDPGVAVWFELRPKQGQTRGDLRVIACDKYTKPEDNAHAVALTLRGLRAFERYGTYTQEQAIEGARIALPPPPGMEQKPWRSVLGDLPPGLAKNDALAIVNKRYRDQASAVNGDEAKMVNLNLAIESARKELSGAREGKE